MCMMESLNYRRIMELYVEISHKSELDFLLIRLDIIQLIEDVAEREFMKNPST